MDDLKRFEFKLDKIDQRINNIDVTLAAQHESLKDHIRRTNILEDQIKPIQKHVAMVDGITKFIGLLGILAGIAEAVAYVLRNK
jgi:hypothetical protein